MDSVQPDTIILMTFLTLLSTGLGTMFWGRLNRVESRFDRLEERFDGQFSALRSEMTQIRSEIGQVRSDLTQVALAVGVQKPAASEG